MPVGRISNVINRFDLTQSILKNAKGLNKIKGQSPESVQLDAIATKLIKDNIRENKLSKEAKDIYKNAAIAVKAINDKNPLKTLSVFI